MLRAAGFTDRDSRPSPTSISAVPRPCLMREYGAGAVYPAKGKCAMIEAAMIWNEPNNKSHWDPALDPDWSLFADHGDPRRPMRSARSTRR